MKSRKIVFFDLETTGVSTVKDRIVSIAASWEDEGGLCERHIYINPTIPIPKEASDVHGITDEAVADSPKFSEVAAGVAEWFKDADIAGYNVARFDIPLLMEEMLRCGIDMTDLNRKVYDAMKVYHKVRPRNLAAALKDFCGEDIEGAHDALNDVRATIKVAKAMMSQTEYTDIEKANELLDGDMADYTGHLVWKNGVLTYNFGKNQGRPVSSDVGYAQWMLGNDFSLFTKKLLRTEINKG